MKIEMNEYQEIDNKFGLKITDYAIIKVVNNYVYIKEDYIDNSYLSTTKSKMGLISLNSKNGLGSMIVKPQYLYISEPIDNVFIYQTLNYKFGLINDFGERIILPIYNDINPLGNGLFEAIIDDKKYYCTIINKSGAEIFKIRFTSLTYDFKTQLAVVGKDNFINIRSMFNYVEPKRKYGVYDLDDNEILPIIYKNICILN